jgi:hypothetical protein
MVLTYSRTERSGHERARAARATAVKRIKRALSKHRPLVIVLGLATVASILTQVWAQQHDLVMAFGDAKSRMLLARQVTDSSNPGLAQLGAIWPAFPQLADLPGVWLNSLFYSGLAGAIPESVSYVATCGLLFLIGKDLANRTASGYIAAAIYSVPNMLFMQAVPMSESMFNLGLVGTVYFLHRWVLSQDRFSFLIAAGLFVVIASQTRYEGWVLFILCLCLLATMSWGRLSKTSEGRAKILLFAFWPAVGVVVWLTYNWVYYGNPLYFENGPYSASRIVKDAVDGAPKSWRSQGDPIKSFLVYGRTVNAMTGLPILLLSVAGLCTFLLNRRQAAQKAVLLLLLFPFPFFVYSLWAGGSVEIWLPRYTGGANWGTRYGVLMLPALAVFGSYILASARGKALPGLQALLVLGLAFAWTGGVLSAGEARQNRDNQQTVAQVASGKWLQAAYNGGGVLLQRFQNETLLLASRVPLSRIISEASPANLYRENLRYPVRRVRWVIISRDATAHYDNVGASLLKNSDFERTFKRVHTDGGTQVWMRVAYLTTPTKGK